MSNGYAQPKIIVSYYPDTENPADQWQDEYAEFVPPAGTFIKRANRCYVVDEVWRVDDKHESIGHGINVFLTTVDIMDHRLGQYHPTYYTPRGEEG